MAQDSDEDEEFLEVVLAYALEDHEDVVVDQESFVDCKVVDLAQMRNGHLVVEEFHEDVVQDWSLVFELHF